MLLLAWLPGPLLIVAGIALRTRAPWSRLCWQALFWLSFMPCSALTLWLLARLGMQLGGS